MDIRPDTLLFCVTGIILYAICLLSTSSEPSVMEGESSEISAIDFSAVEKNISKRALSEEEVRAQKTLVILKSKDTKLLELQSRLKYLEKLAGKIDNCDENQHLKRKMSSEKISSAGDFLSSSETQNSHEQQDSETSMVIQSCCMFSYLTLTRRQSEHEVPVSSSDYACFLSH